MGFMFLVTLNFIPTIIAVCRGHPRSLAIFVINLLLGWTVIGWIVALAMSLGSFTPKQQQPQQIIVVHQNPDGTVPVIASAPPPPPQPAHPGRGQPRPWLEALLPKKDSQRTLA